MISETLSGAPRSSTVSTRRSAASSGDQAVRFVEQLDVADHPGEAVAGEKEDVAGPGIPACDLGLERLLHPDRARDDVGVRVVFRFLGAKHARVDQVLNQAVVAGQLDDLPAANPVGAAVAGPEATELGARNRKPDDRAADRAPDAPPSAISSSSTRSSAPTAVSASSSRP